MNEWMDGGREGGREGGMVQWMDKGNLFQHIISAVHYRSHEPPLSIYRCIKPYMHA